MISLTFICIYMLEPLPYPGIRATGQHCKPEVSQPNLHIQCPQRSGAPVAPRGYCQDPRKGQDDNAVRSRPGNPRTAVIAKDGGP